MQMFLRDVLRWYRPYSFRYMCEFYEPLLSHLFRLLPLSPKAENNLGLCVLVIPIVGILLSNTFALKSLSFKNSLELSNWRHIFDWDSPVIDFLSVFHVIAFAIRMMVIY